MFFVFFFIDDQQKIGTMEKDYDWNVWSMVDSDWLIMVINILQKRILNVTLFNIYYRVPT